MKQVVVVLISISVFVITSCNDGGSPVSGDNNNGSFGTVPQTPNTMVVTVDGVSYTFQCFAARFIWGYDTIVTIAGVDLSFRGVGIGYTKLWSPGTYDIGTVDSTGGMLKMVDMNYMYIAPPRDTVEYITQNSFESSSVGKLKIIELTNTNLKASFYATLPKKRGIAGAPTVLVTRGAVNVELH